MEGFALGTQSKTLGSKKEKEDAGEEKSSFPNLRTTPLTDAQFKRLGHYIESELGIRMPPAKRVMLESRLQKRIRALGLGGFEEYLEFVFQEEQADGELLHMIDAVTTNKTDFFREADHFDYLLGTLLPERYADGWGKGRPFRVWSSASSTGEEPYTLAITLEEFAAQHRDFEYKILGTDISTAALDRGRKATYTEERVAPVPSAYLKKYFLRSKDKESKLVRVKPVLRSKVIFHRLNLMAGDFGIQDRFEVIFCRNVIIYFDRPTQGILLRKLYDYLRPGGYLFLGHSETLAGMGLPLISIAPTIYRRPE
ncbi:MAG: CheR family methyltransferase [Spirochaetaceae bacterium]